ncbi:MAG: hypothetical protein QW406_01825 [Ignisphaera sp.]
MDFNIVKALFYACNSYPKIAAPHRLSPSNDFEICVLTALSSILDIDSNVRRYVEELKKGLRGINDINIGVSIVQGLLSSLRNFGSNAMIEISIASTMSLYINYIIRLQQLDFHESIRCLYRAMSLNDVNETLSFIRTLKNFGGEIAVLLDKADIAERRVFVENMKLSDVLQNLSRVSLKFEAFANMQKVLNVLNTVEDIAKNLNNINLILSRLSLLLLEEKSIKLSDRSIADILKVDMDYRKRNRNMIHIMPYIVFASLYMVLTKGY